MLERGRDGDRVLLAPTSLAVPPGHLLLAEGPDRVARTALAMVLTGRTRPDGGDLRVAGLVLPQQAGAVRRRTGLVRVVEETDPVAAVQRLLAGPSPVDVLVVENLETLADPVLRQEVVDALARACREQGTAAVVTCDPGCADVLVVADDVPAERLALPVGTGVPRHAVGAGEDAGETAPEHDLSVPDPAPVPSLVGGPRP